MAAKTETTRVLKSTDEDLINDVCDALDAAGITFEEWVDYDGVDDVFEIWVNASDARVARALVDVTISC